jgi:putative ABC transport system substrate-binding protein
MLANVGASAQNRGRRIGVLTTGGPAIIPGPNNNLFETVLKEKGWIIGGNLQIEYRITGGDTKLSRAYARELIALQPDVLVAMTGSCPPQPARCWISAG